MKSLVINIKDDNIVDKVLWMLEHFKDDGLEIVSKEDMEDLKLLKETRSEEKINFEDYLKNANWNQKKCNKRLKTNFRTF